MCKRILMIAIALCLLCGSALAADDPTIIQTGKAVFEYYGTMSVGVYAELENTGEHTITFDEGRAGIFDKDGNSIVSSDRVYCYPTVLAPGAKGYAYSILRPDNPEDVAEYRITVTGKATDKEAVLFRTVGAYETVEGGSWTYRYLAAEITNETADKTYDIYCVYALKDAAGQLLYVDMLNAYMLGIPGNGSVFVRTIVPDSLIAYFEANGLAPATVDAIAFKNPYAD
ncbi:MAG: hypothetical protein JW811_02750 [Clostridiales bacterium]|nr:hypothetical protein [Clostridiales bacterium]